MIHDRQIFRDTEEKKNKTVCSSVSIPTLMTLIFGNSKPGSYKFTLFPKIMLQEDYPEKQFFKEHNH